jgi:hypothetical protein
MRSVLVAGGSHARIALTVCVSNGVSSSVLSGSVNTDISDGPQQTLLVAFDPALLSPSDVGGRGGCG